MSIWQKWAVHSDEVQCCWPKAVNLWYIWLRKNLIYEWSFLNCASTYMYYYIELAKYLEYRDTWRQHEVHGVEKNTLKTIYSLVSFSHRCRTSYSICGKFSSTFYFIISPAEKPSFLFAPIVIAFGLTSASKPSCGEV